jgi:F-type H+-transporting ATPase subunit b
MTRRLVRREPRSRREPRNGWEPRNPSGAGGNAPPIESARNRNCETGSPTNGWPEVREYRIEAETLSGQIEVKARHQLNLKWVAGCALVACVLCAGAATASEGGLVLLPDWFGKLPILIVLFALLMYPVNALLFKPIFQVLDAREERTAGTRKRAEKVMKRADETVADYERAVREVRAESEQARKREAAAARKENSTVVDEARTESEQQLEHARTELSAALEESRQTLRTKAQSLADDAASRVLGRPL